jgi:hypothetical protein
MSRGLTALCGISRSLVGVRYPVAVESGGHSMRQLDARDVLKGLRIQDRQFAAIGGPVIDDHCLEGLFDRQAL